MYCFHMCPSFLNATAHIPEGGAAQDVTKHPRLVMQHINVIHIVTQALWRNVCTSMPYMFNSNRSTFLCLDLIEIPQCTQLWRYKIKSQFCLNIGGNLDFLYLYCSLITRSFHRITVDHAPIL